MKLLMLHQYGNQQRCIAAGDVADFDAAEAKELLAGKYARQATAQEIKAFDQRKKNLDEQSLRRQGGRV